MPLYDYECEKCLGVVEHLLSMSFTDNTLPCSECDGTTHRLLSAPAVQSWNKDRRFPNLGQEGDGAMSFDTRSDYKKYLKDNYICELSTDAKKWNRPLNMVVTSTATNANRVTPRCRVEA